MCSLILMVPTDITSKNLLIVPPLEFFTYWNVHVGNYMWVRQNVSCTSGSVNTSKSINHKEDNPIGQHFADHHNACPEGLKVKGFFALNLPTRRGDFDTILLRKEKKTWIFRLGSTTPKGLNNELSLKVFLDQERLNHIHSLIDNHRC